MKKAFNSVDIFGDKYIFDIKGNHYRLIVIMNFRTQICYVRYVPTHVEYGEGKWKK
ncbi:type II toxin-antitoxin system HigB family toxin [Dyella sp.]|uniref:type II toxin-antitoxin system HigB family toxin n=1 Tax=Dyella sp. TaxID=1869338 RepID=UPI0039C86A07